MTTTTNTPAPAPVLETERLTLRQLVPDDVDFLASMLADSEVSKYHERRFARADAAEWLERQMERYARDGHGLWMAQEKTSGQRVGQIGLLMQEVGGQRRPELGWLLDRAFWGKGYATEAGAACRDVAFGRWKYPEVISLIRPSNIPSQHVAERIGLRPGPRVIFRGFEHIVYELRAGE